jgi:signal transduction histidine kinase
VQRRSFFFIRLFGTALVVAVPLLALHVHTLYANLQSAHADAFRALRAESIRAAKEVTDAVEGAERMLSFVAGHDAVRSLASARCTEFLRGLGGVEPLHAVVSVMGPEGKMICTSFPAVGDSRTVPSDSPWLRTARGSEGFVLSEPSIGHLSRRPVAILSLPVRDGNGKSIAIASVSLDLLHLEDAMVGGGLSPGAVFSLFDKDARFLVRSPDTLKWIGRSLPDFLKPLRQRSQLEEITTKGADGIERVYASTALAKYGLRVVAGAPTSVVFDKPYAEIRKGIEVSVAALLSAGLLAYFGARSLARPVRSLASSARAFAKGDADARADESLPGDYKDLAVELNSMHAARNASETKAWLSEKRSMRLAKFYEAVSRTNQAIVRAQGPEEVYDTICKVCVETGQASMAWIGVFDEARLVPVAWGGPAKQYTQTLDLEPGLLARHSDSASVPAREIRIVDDYLNDPQTLPFRAKAAPFGVRSSVIVPFTRGGVVVGTLNLYAGEAAFFDEQVIRLLTEMAVDISFALDNFERASAHQRTLLELVRSEGRLSPAGARDIQTARLAAAVAEAANKAKTQFLSRMSHELRTPLNAVVGFSQLLQEGAKEKLNDKERKQLDLIFLAGAQLRALVDDVLDVSIIESGNLSLSLREFDLNELLDGVIRMSEAAARSSSVKLSSGYTGSKLQLRTDPIRLRQVMLNLVSNAIKYNRPGGSVTIDFEALHGSVCIEVADTGIGMTEEQLANLFQPFNRLGREGSHIAGTGIGMVVVRQLAELMGGSISVTSEIGTGTIVRLEVPRPKVAGVFLDSLSAASMPATLSTELPTQNHINPSGLVLYIEDNPVNVLLVEQMLQAWPEVELVVAEDGDAGISQATELRPDVILLDMQLPDMTGLEVLKSLKGNASTQSLRVVALSASAMEDEVRVAKEAGVLDYWIKPVDVLAFRDGMRSLLQVGRT